MKIFQNKNLFKKLIIVLLFITIFSFCMPKGVKAIDVGGLLLDPVGIGDGINTILSKLIFQTDGSFIVVDTGSEGVGKIIGVIIAAAVIVAGVVLIVSTGGLGATAIAIANSIFTIMKAGVVAGIATFAVTTVYGDAIFGSKVVLPSIRLTPYEIFSNQIPLFDVDFFSPMTDLKTDSSSKVSKNALKSGISSEDVAKEFKDLRNRCWSR